MKKISANQQARAIAFINDLGLRIENPDKTVTELRTAIGPQPKSTFEKKTPDIIMQSESLKAGMGIPSHLDKHHFGTKLRIQIPLYMETIAARFFPSA